jgi:hypothetical protein
MANNRMQIYCKKCLVAFTFAKYYPCSWFSSGSREGLDDFFERHTETCVMKSDGIDESGGTDMFGFRTENDNDGFETAFEPYRVYRKAI